MFPHFKRNQKSKQYHSKLIMANKFYMICDIIQAWKQGFWIQMVNLLDHGAPRQNGEASKALLKIVLVKHKIKQNCKRNQKQQITVLITIFLLTNFYWASSIWNLMLKYNNRDRLTPLLMELMLFLVTPFFFNSSIISIHEQIRVYNIMTQQFYTLLSTHHDKCTLNSVHLFHSSPHPPFIW